MKVYLDNGATTMTDPEVVKEMMPFFTESYGNPSSIYSFSEKPKAAVAKARETIAKTLNAESKEIIFTSGGSETDNFAIWGTAIAAKKKGKNHIITSLIEHPAILNTCKALEQEGYRVTYLDVDKSGFVDIKDIESAMDDKTFLVTIIHGNNEIGTLQDIAAIGKLCHEKNVYFHTDAVQSFTKCPLDVKDMHIDMLSIASHKIHGPKGIGALYVRSGVEITHLITGGHQERNMRAGTENTTGIIGFGKAVEMATPDHVKEMTELRDYMINRILTDIPDTFLNGSKDNKRLCNNVNIGFKFIEGEGILLSLDMHGISVSTGSACASKSLEPSYVLTSIGLSHELAHGCIRFTLSRFTTKEEIDYTLEHLKTTIERLRSMSPLTQEN